MAEQLGIDGRVVKVYRKGVKATGKQPMDANQHHSVAVGYRNRS